MQPKIIYVHGSGNKVRAELLKSHWDNALFGRDMADASHMAYWASVRCRAPLPDSEPDPMEGGPVSGPGVVPALINPAEVFVAKTLSRARGEAAGIAGAIGTAFETWAGGGDGTAPRDEALVTWLRDMTYLADALAGGEDAVPGAEPPLEALHLPRPARDAVFRLLVKYTFRDVYAYFFGDAGQSIRNVFRAALDGLGEFDGPLVVVGHGLGSIVAYEVLREEKTEVELFVTIGSPLAVPEVQDQLERPLEVPDGVETWCNFSDARDLVALDHTIRPEYAPPELITDLLVVNDSGNHHGIREYLRGVPVRRPIRRLFETQAALWP
jgi:hypothetical protein